MDNTCPGSFVPRRLCVYLVATAGACAAAPRRAGRHEQLLLHFGDNEVDFVHCRVLRSCAEVKLTPIEYRLLCAMIAGQGRVLTHRPLLREVWGPAFAESAHYLRIYVGHLRHKLEIDPVRPRHFITETGTGYRFVP